MKGKDQVKLSGFIEMLFLHPSTAFYFLEIVFFSISC